VALVVAVVAVAGCSRDGFEDRTAVVDAGEARVRFTVDSCGLDEATVFVVGRSDRGEVLQAVVQLAEDGASGNAAATGLTVDVGSTTFAAFGETAWERRRGPGEAPGTISWARLRGARIQLAGRADAVDDDGRRLTGSEASAVDLSFDARCDERDER
jgi:hypothetical protein